MVSLVKMANVMASTLVFALVLFGAICHAQSDEMLFNEAEEAALTDLLSRQSPSRVLAIIGQNAAEGEVRPTYTPKRYGISKHQAFRFGKRLDSSNSGIGLMMADGGAGESALVGGAGGADSGASAGGDANLNKYLNKFLEKHKTSGIFRWGK